MVWRALLLGFLSCALSVPDSSACVTVCRDDAAVCIDTAEYEMWECDEKSTSESREMDAQCIWGFVTEAHECILTVIDCIAICVEEVEKKVGGKEEAE